MKKLAAILIMSILILPVLCSCTAQKDTDTQWWEDTSALTSAGSEDTAEPPSLISHLFGEWKNQHGIVEPIDEKTVAGSPYTVKSIKEDERANITATLTVDGSDVVYTVYRYKVGYAEYSYMEARFTAKDILFTYTK